MNLSRRETAVGAKAVCFVPLGNTAFSSRSHASDGSPRASQRSVGTMSTSQRNGPSKNGKRKSSGSGSGSSSSSSSRAPSFRRKQRVGTPGRGVSFEAEVLPSTPGAAGVRGVGNGAGGGGEGDNSGVSESESTGIFSYDEVADLATASTPVGPKRAVAAAAGSGRMVQSRDKQQQQQQPPPEKGKGKGKRRASREEGLEAGRTST